MADLSLIISKIKLNVNGLSALINRESVRLDKMQDQTACPHQVMHLECDTNCLKVKGGENIL